MGQRRIDRTWPIPRVTRHVWARLDKAPQAAPVQGLVLEWRRSADGTWEANVAVAQLGSVLLTWTPAPRIRPIADDRMQTRPRIP